MRRHRWNFEGVERIAGRAFYVWRCADGICGRYAWPVWNYRAATTRRWSA
ncbi:hypothetical protein SEA_RUCHI_56 [Arthrobacter phage Ruchi]|nr:hypothetical protein SEA_BASILISK_57 [Arthrobacter phage Basilisk]WNM69511.1 hypothetical protein SEA_RUCHI_56 [Arthrobacter phage Ruchi]